MAPLLVPLTIPKRAASFDDPFHTEPGLSSHPAKLEVFLYPIREHRSTPESIANPPKEAPPRIFIASHMLPIFDPARALLLRLPKAHKAQDSISIAFITNSALRRNYRNANMLSLCGP